MEKQGIFKDATAVVITGCETKGDTAMINTRYSKTGRVSTARLVKENGVWKIDELK